MYAVIKTGGKQYKVAENDLLRIEKLEVEVGSIITLDNVLLVANDNNDVTVGQPLVSGASVAVEILAQRRARKIIIFKKRRRKSSRTKNGHRQHFTLVRISEILTNGAKPSKPAQGMPEKASLKAVNDSDISETISDSLEEKATKKPRAKKVTAEVQDTIEATEAKTVKKATVKKASKKTETEANNGTDSSND